jgi:adenylate cyclase class 2
MIEVEVKFPVEDVEFVEKRLAEFAEFVIEKTEHDIYFNSPWRDFKETDEALRIRRDEEGISITYKGPKIENKTKTREEIKLKINDYDSGIILLRNLGFFKSGEVLKKRKVFRVQDAVLCLDDVKHLGNFLEIEIQSDKNEIEKNVERVFDLARNFGFTQEQSTRKSYLELLENIR